MRTLVPTICHLSSSLLMWSCILGKQLYLLEHSTYMQIPLPSVSFGGKVGGLSWAQSCEFTLTKLIYAATTNDCLLSAARLHAEPSIWYYPHRTRARHLQVLIPSYLCTLKGSDSSLLRWTPGLNIVFLHHIGFLWQLHTIPLTHNITTHCFRPKDLTI